MSISKEFLDPLVLTKEYENLMKEINNTITKTDTLFKTIQEKAYPNVGDYSSGLLEIDPSIANIEDARSRVWDFLNKKYEENTKLRKFFFDELRKVDERIKELEQKRAALQESIKVKKTSYSTAYRTLNSHKYTIAKQEYYFFLYKVLLFVQILIISLLVVSNLGLIPSTSAYLITVLMIFATAAFVGYYVFFINIARSKYSWTKYEHSNESAKNETCNVSSNYDTPEDKRKKEVDPAIDEIIAQSRGKQ
jgi:hypothetical protein